MSSLNLIMSGAYVGQELTAEFGMLPPAFLPVGVGRLYDLQIELYKKILDSNEKIYLTLPESFEASQYDLNILREKNVSLLFVPDDKTLGEAIIYAVNMLTNRSVSVRILNGDTMFDELPVNMDCVITDVDFDDYAWAGVKHKDGNVESFFQTKPSSEEAVTSLVACGFFSFSDSISLIRCLIISKYDFVNALNLYNDINKMLIIMVSRWYDFGHLQNYFRSRRLVTTVRSFNSMKITKFTVEKSSSDHFKMNAEVHWLENIPNSLQPYSVRVFDHGVTDDCSKTCYSTDYQYAPNLAELFVFSKVGRLTWKKILESCVDFLKICAKYKGNKNRDYYLSKLVDEKTNERINQYIKYSDFNIDHSLRFNGILLPSMREIIKKLQSYVTTDNDIISTVMHGDFCFSNILYNSRNQRISVIDPRGYVFASNAEIYGDLRYDIAKLSHSINGFYDLIIAGRYVLHNSSPYDMNLTFEPAPIRDWLKHEFSKINIAGINVSSNEIQAITALLFISMLPLHADRPDRQKAFLANAIRLYAEIKG